MSFTRGNTGGPTQGYDIIVVGGQSNSTGGYQTGGPDATLDVIPTELPVYHMTTHTQPYDSIVKLTRDQDVDVGSGGNGQIVFATGFAKLYATNKLQTGRRVLIVHGGYSGTSFNNNGNTSYGTVVDSPYSASSYCNNLLASWSPPTAARYYGTNVGDGVVKMNLALSLKNRIAKALATTSYSTLSSSIPSGFPYTNVAPIAGFQNRVVAFLWHQGESDSYQAPNVQYAYALENLVDYIRESAPRSPFICGTLSPYQHQNGLGQISFESYFRSFGTFRVSLPLTGLTGAITTVFPVVVSVPIYPVQTPTQDNTVPMWVYLSAQVGLCGVNPTFTVVSSSRTTLVLQYSGQQVTIPAGTTVTSEFGSATVSASATSTPSLVSPKWYSGVADATPGNNETENPNCADIDNLTPSLIHFTPKGHRVLAQRYYEAFVNAQNYAPASAPVLSSVTAQYLGLQSFNQMLTYTVNWTTNRQADTTNIFYSTSNVGPWTQATMSSNINPAAIALFSQIGNANSDPTKGRDIQIPNVSATYYFMVTESNKFGSASAVSGSIGVTAWSPVLTIYVVRGTTGCVFKATTNTGISPTATATIVVAGQNVSCTMDQLIKGFVCTGLGSANSSYTITVGATVVSGTIGTPPFTSPTSITSNVNFEIQPLYNSSYAPGSYSSSTVVAPTSTDLTIDSGRRFTLGTDPVRPYVLNTFGNGGYGSMYSSGGVVKVQTMCVSLCMKIPLSTSNVVFLRNNSDVKYVGPGPSSGTPTMYFQASSGQHVIMDFNPYPNPAFKAIRATCGYNIKVADYNTDHNDGNWKHLLYSQCPTGSANVNITYSAVGVINAGALTGTLSYTSSGDVPSPGQVATLNGGVFRITSVAILTTNTGTVVGSFVNGTSASSSVTSGSLTFTVPNTFNIFLTDGYQQNRNSGSFKYYDGSGSYPTIGSTMTNLSNTWVDFSGNPFFVGMGTNDTLLITACDFFKQGVAVCSFQLSSYTSNSQASIASGQVHSGGNANFTWSHPYREVLYLNGKVNGVNVNLSGANDFSTVTSSADILHIAGVANSNRFGASMDSIRNYSKAISPISASLNFAQEVSVIGSFVAENLSALMTAANLPMPIFSLPFGAPMAPSCDSLGNLLEYRSGVYPVTVYDPVRGWVYPFSSGVISPHTSPENLMVLPTTFTVSVWVKLIDQTALTYVDIWNGFQTDNDGIKLLFRQNGTQYVSIQAGGAFAGDDPIAGPFLTNVLYKWTQYVMTGTGGVFTLYRNGSPIVITTGGTTWNAGTPVPSPTYPGTSTFSICGVRDPNNSAPGSNALIDNVRVWNTALTSAQVTSLYNNNL